MPAVVSGWGQQVHVHVVCRFHLKNVGSQSAFYWGAAAPVMSAVYKTKALLWLTRLILRVHCWSFSDSRLLNPEKAAEDQCGRAFSADQSSACTVPLFKDGNWSSESRKEQKSKRASEWQFPTGIGMSPVPLPVPRERKGNAYLGNKRWGRGHPWLVHCSLLVQGPTQE